MVGRWAENNEDWKAADIVREVVVDDDGEYKARRASDARWAGEMGGATTVSEKGMRKRHV